MRRASLIESAGGALLTFHCPACGYGHGVTVRPYDPPRPGPVWGWNGSLEAPTITPSINVWPDGRANSHGYPRCHSFVTDGRIAYCGDSEHALAGQTVDLPPEED
jgi:hypothetical protein